MARIFLGLPLMRTPTTHNFLARYDARSWSRHAALLALLVFVARDLERPLTRAHVDVGLNRDGQEWGELARGWAGPSSLPGGGYLRHRVAPQLERQACLASASKAPLHGRLERAVLVAANEQLDLPMGYGRLLPVGGRYYLFCAEPHYHAPGSGFTPEGWHKGVTVYDGSARELRVL